MTTHMAQQNDVVEKKNRILQDMVP